jgi:lysozyme
MSKLEEMLKVHEGVRRFAYRCTSNAITIGIGRNIDPNKGGMGLSDDEVMYLLRNDIKRVYDELDSSYKWFAELDDVRQDVLQDMCFNMGLPSFEKFRKMLAAVELEQWDRAAEEMLNSRWAEQVKGRSIKLANMMRTGAY